MVKSKEDWSPTVCAVCEVCGFLWAILVFGTCTYVVFWLSQSGWWYLLAMILSGGWTCKHFRSPAQIAADGEDN